MNKDESKKNTEFSSFLSDFFKEKKEQKKKKHNFHVVLKFSNINKETKAKKDRIFSFVFVKN